MDLDKIMIYRITHIANIPHILENGITHGDSPNLNPDFKDIGDTSLINNRKVKTVRVTNGDLLGANGEAITLGDFIPFYFGVKMPMLYVIKNGGNFVREATSPRKIVYLVCSLLAVIESGVRYYFTDGHATDILTSFFDNSKIEELPTIIDWQAIRKQYWGGSENLDAKRKKQAEFLSGDDITPDGLKGFGCYDQLAKDKLISMGVQETMIKIIPNSYY